MFFFKSWLVALMVLAAAGAAGAEELFNQPHSLDNLTLIMRGECLEDQLKDQRWIGCEFREGLSRDGAELIFILYADGRSSLAVSLRVHSGAVEMAAPSWVETLFARGTCLVETVPQPYWVKCLVRIVDWQGVAVVNFLRSSPGQPEERLYSFRVNQSTTPRDPSKAGR